MGSGWQAWVAYISLFSYYIFGLPLAFVMGSALHFGVSVCFILEVTQNVLSSNDFFLHPTSSSGKYSNSKFFCNIEKKSLDKVI